MVVLAFAAANGWVVVSTRAFDRRAAEALPSRSVAIVPGNHTSDGRPGWIMDRRLRQALDLYRRGLVRQILVSGVSSEEEPEVDVMQAWLRERGVPDADIIADVGGSRTIETAYRAAALFGVKDAIICTETLHAPRSIFLARSFGIDAVAQPIPTELTRSPRWLGLEAMKNALAVAEVLLGRATPPPGPLVAAR
jgi:SanA protein